MSPPTPPLCNIYYCCIYQKAGMRRMVHGPVLRSLNAKIGHVVCCASPTSNIPGASSVQILANIGEDLLIASADKPFRFPAEFTFVVRSFTVLDGIGKSLSPRFDISEISAPYARELILDGRSAASQLQDKFERGIKRQNMAVKGLFNGPLKIDEINEAVKRFDPQAALRVQCL
jgi:predicted unusual protein kinase regulating ubiquinone biosynthesis (AarF/ABC1/UbiB family)